MEKNRINQRSKSRELIWCGCYLMVKILLLVMYFTSGVTQLDGDYRQVSLPVMDHCLIP